MYIAIVSHCRRVRVLWICLHKGLVALCATRPPTPTNTSDLRPCGRAKLMLLELVGELAHRGLPPASRHSIAFLSDFLRKLVVVLDMAVEVVQSWALPNLSSK